MKIKENIETEYQEPLTELFDRERQEVVDAVLNTLTEKEKGVIRSIFFRNRTRKAIAGQYHRSIDRIQQIEAKALRKLRHPARLRILSECHNFSLEYYLRTATPNYSRFCSIVHCKE